MKLFQIKLDVLIECEEECLEATKMENIKEF